MERLTYKQAYDKIIEAYFKDEIQPYSPQFCFCGTLNDNNSDWFGTELKKDGLYYTHQEMKRMEEVLLITLRNKTIGIGYPKINSGQINVSGMVEIHPNFEDALFEGMCAALEILKQIHKDRGENVDDVPEFKKRELVG